MDSALRWPFAAAAVAAVACAVPPRAADVDATAPVEAAAPAAHVLDLSPALPAAVDLRPDFDSYGLFPRDQGPRGTCSIFTTCAALEFACARANGWTLRLSPEHLNWSAGQAAGRPSDGNFFHNAVAGFERWGISTDAAMPYRASFDPGLAPGAETVAEAAALRDRALAGTTVRWIVPWVADGRGVDEARFEEIRRVLAAGHPVAAGSAHSRLLVGYRDDAAQPGGGAFLTLDSALARFDEVSYQYVREQVCDAFWLDPAPLQRGASQVLPRQR